MNVLQPYKIQCRSEEFGFKRVDKMGDPETDIEKQSYMCNDLITEEILVRLPIKSILRFESVSKQWYSTLSSHNFALSHLNKSPFSHPSASIPFLFIKCGNSYYLSSCYDNHVSGNFEDKLVKLDLEFDVGNGYLKLTGCCNGLICLTPHSDKYFILWNPTTRKLHKYMSDGYLEGFNKMPIHSSVFGFGYSSSIDDYKYVRILRLHWAKEDCMIVHVFSLKEKKWRKIDCDIDLWLIHGEAVLLNEKLYWSGCSKQAGFVIASFDLGLERFDILPYPHSTTSKMPSLGVMGECLCKFTSDEKLMEILKHPTEVKSISLPKGFTLDMWSEMIGLTRGGNFFVTGPLILGVRDCKSRMLGMIDVSTEPMQYSMLLRFEGSVNIARYIPSLVSPFPIEELPEA